MIIGKAKLLRNRLTTLSQEIQNAAVSGFDFADRIRELYNIYEKNLIVKSIIEELPEETIDLDVDRFERENVFNTGNPYGLRWNVIVRISETGNAQPFWHFIGEQKRVNGYLKIHSIFIEPIINYIIHKIEINSSILYLLLRHKLLVEWFQGEDLFSTYQDSDQRNGENILDTHLRKFLFESGIDYPFSQPASPYGRADIVANLETNDPLVLEVKIWDSSKNYGLNRIRDGIRQIVDYAERFGKNIGYLAIYNADERQLNFINSNIDAAWPCQVEINGKLFYIIDIQLNMNQTSVSQREKGKKVEYQKVDLEEIMNQ